MPKNKHPNNVFTFHRNTFSFFLMLQIHLILPCFVIYSCRFRFVYVVFKCCPNRVQFSLNCQYDQRKRLHRNYFEFIPVQHDAWVLPFLDPASDYQSHSIQFCKWKRKWEKKNNTKLINLIKSFGWKLLNICIKSARFSVFVHLSLFSI